MRGPRHVLKGHGTENDFVLVPDPDGAFDLDAAQVRALCDRRAGIGGDGVLRVVRTARVPEFAGLADRAEWFMDYRNADGSTAEMCGNGIRVFFRYLQRTGVVEQEAAVATRGGIMRVRPSPDGNVAVEFGQPQVLADRPVVTAAPGPEPTGTTLAALLVPNPHVVVEVTAERAGRARPHPRPGRRPAAAGRAERRVRRARRATGTCACGCTSAARARRARAGPGSSPRPSRSPTADGAGADGRPWRVDVPGGTCHVTWTADAVTLSGPAVLVGEIDLDASWWQCANP